MKTRLEIDTNTFIRFWLVVFGFLFVIGAIFMAKTGLIIIGTAFFLALALSKPVEIIENCLPGKNKNRMLATAAAFVIVVAFLGALVTLVVPPIIEQTLRFIESAPQAINSLSNQWEGFARFVEQYNIRPQIDSAIEGLRNNATGIAADAGKNVFNGLGTAFSALAEVILVLILTFLMLLEGPTWLKRIWGVYTDEKKMQHHKKIANKMYGVVTGYVTGQLTVSGIGALCAGSVVFIMSLIFNIPANLALPTIAICFVLALVPMFGSTIAGASVGVLLAANDLPAGIVFVVYYLIYQQIENNFLVPTIQSKRVELSALTVLVSVTIGLYVFGLAGGIISIPIAGCINVLIDDYLARKNTERKELKKQAKLES